VSGHPTIDAAAFEAFFATTEADSVRVVLEESSAEFFAAVVAPIWPAITAPALVVDGALDLTVGEARARALYDALGSAEKQLVTLPRNAHAWFLEDNFHSTMRVFDAFLAHASNGESE
jgi:alpha-beta hydrolase superfamily lysophospholipase